MSKTPSKESLATAQRIDAGEFVDRVRGWDIYDRAIISRDGRFFVGGIGPVTEHEEMPKARL